ncbi:MAG: hypothetical protein H0U99_04680 [Chthoniobacterales bacterium]|nr:hypothetical protein [Chthoniobacterales bacterium]
MIQIVKSMIEPPVMIRDCIRTVDIERRSELIGHALQVYCLTMETLIAVVE